MDSQKKKSIRVFSIIVLISVFCAFVYFILLQGKDRINIAIEAEFEKTQIALTKQIARVATVDLRRINDSLEVFAPTTEILDFPSEECVAFVKRAIVQTNLPISSLSRTNSDKVFDCSNFETSVGIDGSRFDYINDIFADPEHKTVIGRGFLNSSVQGIPQFITAIHVPIFDEEQNFKGTVGSAIFFTHFMNSVLENIDIPNSSTVVLSDDNGDILYHTDPTYIGVNIHEISKNTALGQNSELQELFRRSELGETGVIKYFYNGKEDIASFAPISTPSNRNWSITISTPVSRIGPTFLPIITAIQKEIIISIGISLVLLLAIIFIFIKKNAVVKQEISGDSKEHSGKDNVPSLSVGKREMKDVRESSATNEDDLKKSVDNVARTKKAMLNVMEDLKVEKQVAESLKFRLESAQKAAKFGVFDWDINKNTLLWDKQMYNLYNIQKSIPITFDLWEKQFINEDKDVLKKALQDALKSKEDLNITLRVKEGSNTTFLKCIAKVFRDSNGNPKRMIGINYDITKEKEIDKAKSEFVSLASHQLRTPLSTINWYAEMLLAGDVGELNEEQKKYLQEIFDGNQRMVGLVNALLDVSRIELGTFAVEPEATDVKKVLKGAIDDVVPMIQQKKLHIEENLDKDIPIIQADPKLLSIVFQNLITNAVKYTPEEGKIRVSIFLDIQKDAIKVEVADTGFGIPEQQKKRIFSKLFRADNVKKKDTVGTGLGLYIVKSIVEHSGGTIYFESEEDKGTTFFVNLPLKGMIKKEGTKTLGS